MNISIEKKIFSEAVYRATRFAEKKSSTLPALSAILILAGDSEIKMRATNLEVGIDMRVEGKINEDGVVAIPATILQQIAGSLLGDGSITLEHVGDTVTITSGASRSTIKTIPYDDFPSIPFPENTTNKTQIPGNLLKGLLTSISACASVSTVRPELASVLFSIEGGILTVVATDSFRLAEKRVPLGNKGLQGTFLLPAKNAAEIAQALSDEDVTMSFDDHQCALIDSNNSIVSRLTNATYPDYRQIIPKDFVVEATVLRKDFETALKRTTIFSDSFQKVTFNFDTKKNTLSLAAKNSDIGESIESLNAQVTGANLILSFNHRFVSTIFHLTNSESVTLSAAGIGRPLIIKGVGDNSLLYLVSPMNQ